MKRASQKETIFYILYKRFKEGKKDFLPVFGLMGEHYIEEVGKWGYVSYECSARCSEMRKENPGLIHREWMRGRSGAKYYGYRLNPEPRRELIKDPALLALHARLAKLKVPTRAEQEAAVEEAWKKL